MDTIPTIENRERLQFPYKVLTFIAHESTPGYRSLDSNGAGMSAGGSAVVAEMQTRELGSSATILSPRPSKEYIPPDPSHIFFDPIVPEEIYKNPLGNMKLVAEILHAAENVNIIYAHYPVAGAIIAALKKEGYLGEKKFVYMGHTWGRVVDPTNENRRRHINPQRYHAEQMILEQADGIVTATNAERKMIARDYAIPFSPSAVNAVLQKIHVVPLGVDHTQFNPEKRMIRRTEVREKYLGQYANSLNFFMLARFETLKGQLAAVKSFTDAYRYLKTSGQFHDISLSLFGGPLSGSYYDQIITYLQDIPEDIREEVRSRVLFHGAAPPLDAIATGDVFLGPSSFESFYLSFVESGACGLPAILSDIPTICEVAGQSPWYVTPPDSNDADGKDIICGVVAMATDVDYRETCGQAVFQQVSQYTWKNSDAKLREVFKQIMSKPSASVNN